eukprot:INCI15414.2.p1 GENE.INCI15414.2~~INCI15414.2.p1  ORF type:complete len:380 (-),score=87.78 INCI15414.2:94-1233(-)
MGNTESKSIPDAFRQLSDADQRDFEARYEALLACGTSPEAAVLELEAVHAATNDPAALLAADSNHDGKLTAGEIAAAMERSGASKEAAAAASSAVMSTADTNHDGAIDVEELKKFASDADIRLAVAGGALVVDLRGIEEGKIKGNLVPRSLKIPYVPADDGRSFVEAVKNGALPADRNTKIVLHCQSGRRAGWAIEKLCKLGYCNVLNGATGGAINAALARFATDEDIRDAVRRRAVLLDVRGVEEVAKAGDKVPGALIVPYKKDDNGESFNKEATQRLPKDRITPILVHCRSGARAGAAIDRLHELGFVNAVNGCNSAVVKQALDRAAQEVDDAQAKRIAAMMPPSRKTKKRCRMCRALLTTVWLASALMVSSRRKSR